MRAGSGKPDFPFCLAWANHDWKTGTWVNKGDNQMICEQLYPGDEDYIAHFNYVLKAFRDHRYITVDGKPLFLIYDPYIGCPLKCGSYGILIHDTHHDVNVEL